MPQRRTVACSSVWNTKRSKNTPITPMAMSVESMTPALRNSAALKMISPRPSFGLASNSPPMTPIQARPKASRAPVMI
jgi:hypothetical protein